MTATTSQNTELLRPVGDGLIESSAIAQQLHVNTTQLADVLGLGVESLHRRERESAASVQSCMRALVEISNRARPWAGSVNQAFAWYRSQPLPSFGGQTAEVLVKQGNAAVVKAYLSRINEGGYA